MTLSFHQWHERYQQQAKWTSDLRSYIYDQIKIKNLANVLDLGCGTGILLEELKDRTSCNLFGVDIEAGVLSIAHTLAPEACLTNGDAHDLPFRATFFDACICHFVLLWIKNPGKAIKEMIRVTRPGGFIIALAEPDYGGRIDFPEELSKIGIWQTDALQKQGANPFIGRQLRSLFTQAKLVDIEVGILGGQWKNSFLIKDFDLEWSVINSDLHLNVEFADNSNRLKSLDRESRESQHRILYVPTFYAIGKVNT